MREHGAKLDPNKGIPGPHLPKQGMPVSKIPTPTHLSIPTQPPYPDAHSLKMKGNIDRGVGI